jgi:hypothetical protein
MSSPTIRAQSSRRRGSTVYHRVDIVNLDHSPHNLSVGLAIHELVRERFTVYLQRYSSKPGYETRQAMLTVRDDRECCTQCFYPLSPGRNHDESPRMRSNMGVYTPVKPSNDSAHTQGIYTYAKLLFRGAEGWTYHLTVAMSAFGHEAP